MKDVIKICLLATTLALAACGGGGGSSDTADDAVDNSVGASTTLEALGGKIFFDTNLSKNNNQSCASCHAPAAGFADPRVSETAPVSEGSDALAFGNRNAPTAAYASFIPIFTPTVNTTAGGTVSNFQGGQFLDGRRDTLADQAKDPFLNPVEMNNASVAAVVDAVRNADYAGDFVEIFGADAFADTARAYDDIATAIAAFETSTEMNPFSSKFDAVMAGEEVFSASEQRGFDLFTGVGPRDAKCANCHTVDSPPAGSLFTDFNYYNVGVPVNTDNPAWIADNSFRDRGLGDAPQLDAQPAAQIAERGKFRVPTLRNIELTAPYMHNGVHATLDEVLQHYDVDVANEFVMPEVNINIANELDAGGFTGLGLQPQDFTDLKNFLLTLTDGYR